MFVEGSVVTCISVRLRTILFFFSEKLLHEIPTHGSCDKRGRKSEKKKSGPNLLL